MRKVKLSRYNSSDGSHHLRPNIGAKRDDCLLDGAAFGWERSDNDPVYAGLRKRNDLIGNLFYGPSEGQRLDVAISDQWQQRQIWIAI
jgi:hypothetical protein